MNLLRLCAPALITWLACLACGGELPTTEHTEDELVFGTLTSFDLEPIPSVPNYCGYGLAPHVALFGGRFFRVGVRNNGNVASPLTEWSLEAETRNGPVVMQGTINPLAPGASTSVPAIAPDACFQPDCHFKITIDPSRKVNETDRSNNLGFGGCRGATLQELVQGL